VDVDVAGPVNRIEGGTGTGLQSAGGGPSWTPTTQQARQVSVALMFHVPGWRKVTPQSAVPFAPVWATAFGLRTISVEPR
jgi:hypothetical protein